MKQNHSTFSLLYQELESISFYNVPLQETLNTYNLPACHAALEIHIYAHQILLTTYKQGIVHFLSLPV